MNSSRSTNNNAAQGWKLQQILRQHEQQPSYQQMIDDFKPQYACITWQNMLPKETHDHSVCQQAS